MVKCRVIIIEALHLDRQPGWCKALLIDSKGKKHFFVEKLPIIGLDYDEIGQIPIEKYIRAEIENDYGEIVEINTENPDDIETIDGENHFSVFRRELVFQK